MSDQTEHPVTIYYTAPGDSDIRHVHVNAAWAKDAEDKLREMGRTIVPTMLALAGVTQQDFS